MSVAPNLPEVNDRMTKSQIIEAYQSVRDRLLRHEDANLGRLRDLEQRLRALGQRDYTLQTVILTGEQEEWKDTIAFLSEVEDVLPPPLARVLEGARALQETSV